MITFCTVVSFTISICSSLSKMRVQNPCLVKNFSICQSFRSRNDSLSSRTTLSGKRMRSYCSFLLAVKLKRKSSNSPSAAFGMGVAAMRLSMAVIGTVSCGATVSTGTVSATSVGSVSAGLSLHPQKKVSVTRARVSQTVFLFIMIVLSGMDCKISEIILYASTKGAKNQKNRKLLRHIGPISEKMPTFASNPHACP